MPTWRVYFMDSSEKCVKVTQAFMAIHIVQICQWRLFYAVLYWVSRLTKYDFVNRAYSQKVASAAIRLLALPEGESWKGRS